MIVERGGKPEVFDSRNIRLFEDKLRDFYHSENRSQKRYDFPFNHKFDDEVRPHLHSVFHGKCGYCEIAISSVDHGIVDRFRPFSGVREDKNYYADLYWWLTFQWDNLVLSCKECSQYKANYFPVRNQRALKEGDDLGLENCLLLDPCKDDPEEYYYYDSDGIMHSHTERGRQTIELLRLNRDKHVELRLQIREEILRYLTNPLTATRRGADYVLGVEANNPRMEFLSFAKWVVLQESRELPLVKMYFGNRGAPMVKTDIPPHTPAPAAASVTNDYFPIEFIKIKNFKGITDLTVDFKEDGLNNKSWLFLLGENGVGKSSILQAIAVGLQVDNSFLRPLVARLIQKGKEKAEIIIKERNSDNKLRTVLTRKGNKITHTGSFNSFLIGYGSLRLSAEVADEEPEKDENKVSYANLFSPVRPLNDVTQWLVDIHEGKPEFFDSVAYSIKQLLPHDFIDNELTVRKDEILFKNSDKLFAELSDGFRSTIILAVDIMMKLSSAQADMDKLSGVVLIDELGNQLHPRWQMRIVKQLRIVFKNLNFIVSTHHPLCLRGSEIGEVLLLRNIDNQIHPLTDLPDPAALRVDQILASEFFGLNSLIDPELEATFNRYYALLAKEEDVTSVEREEIGRLKDELRNKKQLGASLREELMYTVIDNLLAKKVVFDKQPLNRQGLKEEVVRRVAEIWSKLNIDGSDQY